MILLFIEVYHFVLLCSSSVVSSYIVAFEWSCLLVMYGFDPKTATGNLWSTLVSLLYLQHVLCTLYTKCTLNTSSQYMFGVFNFFVHVIKISCILSSPFMTIGGYSEFAVLFMYQFKCSRLSDCFSKEILLQNDSVSWRTS